MYRYKYQDRLDKFVEKINLISDIQWAYLAGLLDGEGSIGLYQDTRRDFTSIMLRITLIVNTDKELINYVSNLIGEEFVYKTNKSNCWCVKISHRALAEQFLINILPYLVGKKQRAINALKFIESRKGRFHHKFSEEELEMVKLSKKGNAKMGKALYYG